MTLLLSLFLTVVCVAAAIICRIVLKKRSKFWVPVFVLLIVLAAAFFGYSLLTLFFVYSLT